MVGPAATPLPAAPVPPALVQPEVARAAETSAPQAVTTPPPMPTAPPPGPSVPPAAVSSPSAAPRSSVRSAAESVGTVDASQAARHRALLAKLIDAAAGSADLEALSREPVDPATTAQLDRSLAQHAAAMRSELPADLDPETLVGEARRELLELGPIGPLLEDEGVEEIQVIRHDHVVALHDKKQVATEIAFSSEAAVARIVRRLAARSGLPLTSDEQFVDRRLMGGARLFAVLPPASGDAHMLVIRKPRRADASIEDLVRTGAISRAMASFFALAVQGRANILVTSAVGGGAPTLLGALAGAGDLEDRLVVLQEDDELVFNQPHTVSILLGNTAQEGARAVRAAIRVRPDRLVVGAFAGHVVGVELRHGGRQAQGRQQGVLPVGQ